MNKIIRSYVLPGLLGITAGLAISHGIGKAIDAERTSAAEELYNKTIELYDNARDRIETEQAIRAEGIRAKSYTEAKIKLDSIRTDRLFKSYNMTPPNENDDGMSKLIKHVELNQRQLEDIQNKLESFNQ